MNERPNQADEVSTNLEGRQDSRPGTAVPENRFGKDRARQYNSDSSGAGGGAYAAGGARSGAVGGFRPRPPRSEAEMRETVMQAFAAEPELAGTNLQAEVHDGVIVLRGRVSSARMRALAEDCLDEIEYVHVIRNEIEVRVGARGFPGVSAPTGPVLPGGLRLAPARATGGGQGEKDLEEPLRRSA